MSTISIAKKFSILRKAMSASCYSGTILLCTVDGEAYNKLTVHSGVFFTDQTTKKGLSLLLNKDLQHCEFVIQSSDKDVREPKPSIIFTQILNNICWDETQLTQLQILFAALPAVTVEMVSMHRYDYNDGLSYLVLFQSFKRHSNFTLKMFLDEKHPFTSLEQKIKVLVLGYCLSLINPVKAKVKKTTPVRSEKLKKKQRFHSGLATAVLRKIRGL